MFVSFVVKFFRLLSFPLVRGKNFSTFFIFGKASCTAAPYIYMNVFTNLFLQAKEFLFPGACALCGCSLIEAEEIRFSLCLNCSDGLTEALRRSDLDSKCNLCGKPMISEIETCLSCRNGEARFFERLWVLFPYIGNFRKLLTAYKFGKNLALADFFAEKITGLLKDSVCKEIPDLKNAVIVPVPPRPGKIKDTGWDQVERLVNRLEKIPGIPIVVRCLKRRKSKVQKKLDRQERLENLKGRIYLNKAYTPQPVYILIDDVITTGSTLEVCSAALKSAGAQKVYCICLFYD